MNQDGASNSNSQTGGVTKKISKKSSSSFRARAYPSYEVRELTPNKYISPSSKCDNIARKKNDPTKNNKLLALP